MGVLTSGAIATKSSTEIKDFTLDWTSILGSDTIASSEFSIDGTGASITENTNTTTQATVWVSGGVPTTFYNVTNTIITAAGRTLTKTFKLQVLIANYN